jgi:hypothetical protein
MYRYSTRVISSARVGDVCFRHGICQRLRNQEEKAATLDGLGTVAVLLLLFFGLMFL